MRRPISKTLEKGKKYCGRVEREVQSQKIVKMDIRPQQICKELMSDLGNGEKIDLDL